MTIQARALIAIGFTITLGGGAYAAGIDPGEDAPGELRKVNYCHQPGSRCGAMESLPDDVQAELIELYWCCPYAPESCYHVAFPSACDPDAEYLVWCEWGRSIPQSGGTGTGFECFW